MIVQRATMALNSLFCADVPLSNYSLTQRATLIDMVKIGAECQQLWQQKTQTKDVLKQKKNRHIQYVFASLHVTLGAH